MLRTLRTTNVQMWMLAWRTSKLSYVNVKQPPSTFASNTRVGVVISLPYYPRHVYRRDIRSLELTFCQASFRSRILFLTQDTPCFEAVILPLLQEYSREKVALESTLQLNHRLTVELIERWGQLGLQAQLSEEEVSREMRGYLEARNEAINRLQRNMVIFYMIQVM